MNATHGTGTRCRKAGSCGDANHSWQRGKGISQSTQTAGQGRKRSAMAKSAKPYKHSQEATQPGHPHSRTDTAGYTQPDRRSLYGAAGETGKESRREKNGRSAVRIPAKRGDGAAR